MANFLRRQARAGLEHDPPPAAHEIGRLRSEFERLLDADDCPACTFLTETERSFFAWFVNENHTAASVQAQLRSSMGMCPCHSRRLIEDPGPGPVATTVVGQALAGAQARLRDDAARDGPCPACDAVARGSADVRHLVLDALTRDRDVGRYREHPGMCLEHVLAVADSADPRSLKLVAERLLDALGSCGPSALPALLAGTDCDAPRRARWRQRLAAPEQAASTTARLGAYLSVDACPVCLAAGIAERGYVEWFLECSRRGDPSLRTDPGELCAGHLHDAMLVDSDAANYAIDRKRTVTMEALERLLHGLAEPLTPGGRRRGAGSAASEHVRVTLAATHHCPACRARSIAEARQLELLGAALALAPVRTPYERGHGLCVRHALRLTSKFDAKMAWRLVDDRVAVLRWEVEEIRRKQAWACRHERVGPEHDAWLRALVQIDGRVLLGGPARPLPQLEHA